MHDIISNFLLSVAAYLALVLFPLFAVVIDYMFIYSTHRRWQARDFLVCYVLYAIVIDCLLIAFVPELRHLVARSPTYCKDFALLCKQHGSSVLELLCRLLLNLL